MAGKKIGVSRLGTATHFALQTAIDSHGVKGVTILQMGGQPEALARLVRALGGRRGVFAALQFPIEEARL